MTKVIFDFDWTIVDDNTDIFIVKETYPELLDLQSSLSKEGMVWCEVMHNIVMKIWEKWNEELKGEKNQSWEEYLHFIFSKIPFSFGHKETIKLCHAVLNTNSLSIISDANTFFIQSILQGAKLNKYFKEIITNPTSFDEFGKLHIKGYQQHIDELSQHEEGYTKGHNCLNNCRLNICKGKELCNIIYDKSNNNQRAERVIYVGDGHNDLCAALQLSSNDYLFVRKNFVLDKLIEQIKLGQLTNKKGEIYSLRANIQYWESGNDLFALFWKLFVDHQMVPKSIDFNMLKEIYIENDLDEDLKLQRYQWREFKEMELKRIGEFWDCQAESYEEKVTLSWGYSAPLLCSYLFFDYFFKENENVKRGKKIKVLDAGAGTGLAGGELIRIFRDRYLDEYPLCSLELEALDISEKMIDVCKGKKYYGDHHVFPLSSSISLSNYLLKQNGKEKYEGVVCVGIFDVSGPSPRQSFFDFIDITQPNGIICFTLRLDYLLHLNNESEFEEMVKQITSPSSERKCSLLFTSPAIRYLPSVEPTAYYRIWLFKKM